MIKKILSISAFVVAFPAIVSAQTNISYIDGLLSNVSTLLSRLPALFIAIAVVYFLWGVVVFVSAAGDEDARKKGREKMIWGLVGIAVMVSLWGIIALLQTVFGVSGGAAPTPPPLP